MNTVPNKNKKIQTTSMAQACAACRYQRRRCAPDCLLAPYFPADRLKDFLNAHKLFGVGNIHKILREVPEHERANAVKSLIYEANVRAEDRAGGCRRVIRELEKRIRLCSTELELVRRKIEVCRAQVLRKEMRDCGIVCDCCCPVQGSRLYRARFC